MNTTGASLFQPCCWAATTHGTAMPWPDCQLYTEQEQRDHGSSSSSIVLVKPYPKEDPLVLHNTCDGQWFRCCSHRAWCMDSLPASRCLGAHPVLHITMVVHIERYLHEQLAQDWLSVHHFVERT